MWNATNATGNRNRDILSSRLTLLINGVAAVAEPSRLTSVRCLSRPSLPCETIFDRRDESLPDDRQYAPFPTRQFHIEVTIPPHGQRLAPYCRLCSTTSGCCSSLMTMGTTSPALERRRKFTCLSSQLIITTSGGRSASSSSRVQLTTMGVFPERQNIVVAVDDFPLFEPLP